MGRLFTNGPGDRGRSPGQVILKTQKMVLDASWLITQLYKLRIKGKWNNPGEKSSTLLNTVVEAIEKRGFGSPLTIVANFTFTMVTIHMIIWVLDIGV